MWAMHCSCQWFSVNIIQTKVRPSFPDGLRAWSKLEADKHRQHVGARFMGREQSLSSGVHDDKSLLHFLPVFFRTSRILFESWGFFERWSLFDKELIFCEHSDSSESKFEQVDSILLDKWNGKEKKGRVRQANTRSCRLKQSGSLLHDANI